MDRFVILAAPRTGSNLLCTLLQSHPEVLCHHEIFNPGGIFVALPLRDTGFSFGTIAEREADPLAFLDRVWSEKLGSKLVGFKMTHIQQKKVFNTICNDSSIYKIILKRKACLKTYVSRLLAERSGVWEDYRELDYISPPSRVEVDYQHLKLSIRQNSQFYESLNDLIKGPRFDVFYEDILDRDTQQRLLKYLRLGDHQLTPQSRRQNPYPLSELIANRTLLAEQLSRNIEDRPLLAELDGL